MPMKFPSASQAESVAHKVRFALHEYVGAENLKINVYVDKIKD